MSYSVSYCLSSHRSGKLSRIVFMVTGPDPYRPLDDSEDEFELELGNNSNSLSVPIVSKEAFSLLITVLAVSNLNF